MIKKGGVLKYFVVLFFILSYFFSGFFYWQKNAEAEETSVLINEIAWMGTENSSNDEWIELFNNTGEDIDLDVWQLTSQDGSPEINLSGFIGAGSYYLLERSDDGTVAEKIADLIYTGALGNSGEYLELKNASGTVIDYIDASGAWPAGSNANKNTMSRTSEGEWLDSLDFLGTPGELNLFASSSEEESDDLPDEQASSSPSSEDESQGFGNTEGASQSGNGLSEKNPVHIIISEIFPNPYGEDKQEEFIELYNAGQETVNLFEWQVSNESGQRFRIQKTKKIKAHGYLLLFRAETKIAMSNNGDIISLYEKNKKTATQKIKYKKAIEGMSLNCLTSDLEVLGELANVDCEWSELITKGEVNQMQIPNREPRADFSVGDFLLARTPIIFDSSDTFDLDDDDLKYFWDFGDEYFSSFASPDHTYAQAGEYDVSLLVFDGALENKILKTINIMDWKIDREVKGTNTEMAIDYSNLEISQVLPNPKGVDIDGEYVEIVNNGQTKINLLNWQIDDAEGGSKPYIFKTPTFLSSGESFLLAREDSGLAFNNNRDEVRLIAPDKSIVDLVSYKKPKEGEIYTKNKDGLWLWSSEIGIKNNKEVEVISKNTKKIIIQKTQKTITSQLENLEKIKLGSMVLLKGYVSSVPGVLASQYFYIEDGKGAQVYSYKKYFPSLLVGDYISVWGETGMINDEYRIKTKTANDIKIIEHAEVPRAREMKIKELKDATLSLLYKISGEVVEKKGSSIYLDDGSAEILVYVKISTDIIFENIKKGDELMVQGILSNTRNDRRLMPRSQKDIVFLNKNNLELNKKGKVLGEEIKDESWSLELREKTSKEYIYILMIGVFFLIVFIGRLIYKKIE